MKLLPTTTARDYKGSAKGFTDRRDGGPDIEGAVVKLLPTPMANHSGNSPEDHLRKKPGRSTVTDLAIIVENGLTQSGGKLLPTHSTTVVQDWDTEDWGPYLPAIKRWERIVDAKAPVPVDINRNGKPRISAAFSEWMMGWPEGWVTRLITEDRKLWKQGMTSRTQAMIMIGNGVVPQQAALAIKTLLGEW